jgi:hypothetical protein
MGKMLEFKLPNLTASGNIEDGMLIKHDPGVTGSIIPGVWDEGNQGTIPSCQTGGSRKWEFYLFFEKILKRLRWRKLRKVMEKKALVPWCQLIPYKIIG